MITRRITRSVNVFATLVASAALMAGFAAPASAGPSLSSDFMGGYSLFISYSAIIIWPPM